MNIDSNTDAVFKINLQQSANYTFEVTSTQTTVNTPLVVNDRVEDKTGFIMPVGAIISYGGSTPPKGWLLCDGQAVSKDFYPDLFEAIGNAWGRGDGTATFNLPDLRGQFLRGVSGTSNVDPNKNNRYALYNGNTGNNEGSYQEGATALPNNAFLGTTTAVENHNHTITVVEQNDHGGGGGPNLAPLTNTNGVLSYNGTAVSTLPTSNAATSSHNLTVKSGGDGETRPKNANVNFIIKY